MSYADAYKECLWIDFNTLESFMREALVANGTPEDEAKIVADVLIESDKRGIDSHGIGRFKPIYIDRMDQGILDKSTHLDVIKNTETTAVVDGHNGLGHVVAKFSMDMAINKAKQYGMGMVAVKNSTHYGIAGYYATMASKQNMIGITGTNARPSIAPTFGVENMIGTNPLTFGIPTDEDFDFILDCATSVSQRGKIESYERAGKELPEGWVIGRDGKTRTDTAQVLVDLTKGKAALAPLGGIGEIGAGYKGYGYSLVVEILCAALQNGAYLKMLNGFDEEGNRIPYPLGHFFIAINIENFINPSLFKKTAGNILRDIRASEVAPDAEKIYTPGEKEWIAWNYRKDHGCPIPIVLQKQMTELRERFNLTSYTFPWD